MTISKCTCGHYLVYHQAAGECLQSECNCKEYKPCEVVAQPASKPEKPRVVCLCGSTRFGSTFQAAQLDKTLAGEIVLTIGCNIRSDIEIFGGMTEPEKTTIKTKLDELHKRKIDLSDYIFVLNVGGYIGESTRSEINYAIKTGKPVKYLEAV